MPLPSTDIHSEIPTNLYHRSMFDKELGVPEAPLSSLSEPSPKSTPPLSPYLHPTSFTTGAKTSLALAQELAALPETVTLDGYSLSIAEVVASSRHGKAAAISKDRAITERIDQSIEFLRSKLSTSIYGVSTGFGGSADTRTQHPQALQISLLEHQLCGVLPSSFDAASNAHSTGAFMPEQVVRGAMLIRVNSLCRGHSAVRLVVLETILRFLEEGITPVVPLRGTISASGDLSPLSYIAGAITGHPDIKVTVRGKPGVMLAPDALKMFNIEKVVLGPKEGLGLVNGTAVSASMASHALHDTHFATLLSQALTALTVEAMVGHAGSFHPFIHDITRPHAGQVEAARNIRNMLHSSKFAVHHETEVGVKEDEGVLRQDRYPLRTSAQWIGPFISDLVMAHGTLSVELNSTTDNPLVDVENSLFHHGGNFQAMSVTNTMEKTRLGLQHLGKMSFAQMTEMANCTMNRGLPSCLAAEDASTNYHVKGLDIAAASYTSELGFLANPVSTHVQSAEMGNQAINSLALISGRKTMESLDVLSMLFATHLYCVLQALDLRYLEFQFRDIFNPSVAQSLKTHFGGFLSSSEIEAAARKVRESIWRRLEQTQNLDLAARFDDAFAHTSSVLIDALTSSTHVSSGGNPLAAIGEWRKSSVEFAVTLTRKIRDEFFAKETSPTTEYLGATKALYSFVRNDLGVKTRRGDVFLGKQEKTIGSSVSLIYESIRSGKINSVLVAMMS